MTTEKNKSAQPETNMWRLAVAAVTELFTINSGAAIGCILLALAVSIISSAMSVDLRAGGTAILLQIGFLGISAMVSLVAVYVAMSTAAGKKITFRSAVNSAMENFLVYLGYLTAFSGILFLGLIALVFPAILFTAWFSLIYFIKFSEGGSLREVFSKSRQLVKGHVWEFYALTLVGIPMSLFGLLGPAVTTVILAAWYRQLKANPNYKPSTSTYITVLGALLLGVVLFAAILTAFKNSI